MRGNPTCGHPIQCHVNDNSITNNNNFTTPPPHELPECHIAFKHFNNSNSNRGPPAPNHHNFLTIIEGEIIEAIQCVQAYNQNEATLDKEFEPHERNSVRKKLPYFCA